MNILLEHISYYPYLTHGVLAWNQIGQHAVICIFHVINVFAFLLTELFFTKQFDQVLVFLSAIGSNFITTKSTDKPRIAYLLVRKVPLFPLITWLGILLIYCVSVLGNRSKALDSITNKKISFQKVKFICSSF